MRLLRNIPKRHTIIGAAEADRRDLFLAAALRLGAPSRMTSQSSMQTLLQAGREARIYEGLLFDKVDLHRGACHIQHRR